MQDYIDYLKRDLTNDLNKHKDKLDHKLETLYFGGGTPSLLEPDELKDIIDTIIGNIKID